MLYRVALERANLIKMSLVSATAMLAICLLTVVETTDTAEAISLPKNGKLAFAGMHPRDLNTTYNWEIYTVNADGSELLKLTTNTSIDTAPAWSPDGTKIAFTREDVYQEIYVMNADGTEQRRLTYQNGDNSYPAWSPDGTKIAFTSTRAGTRDIFVMDPDGGNVRRLTNNSGSSVSSVNPSWSPDGTKVAYERSPPEWPEIYTMNVDGTGEKALTNNPSPDAHPDWSPDGRRLVYHGNSGVLIMNADGTEQSPLHGAGGSPAWSPDGKKVLFEATIDDEIAAINPDGGGLTYITRTPHLDVREPDWQPLTPKSRSMTLHPPNTGGQSLLLLSLVASALLFSVGSLLYAVVQRRL
jgi:TolB protein